MEQTNCVREESVKNEGGWPLHQDSVIRKGETDYQTHLLRYQY